MRGFWGRKAGQLAQHHLKCVEARTLGYFPSHHEALTRRSRLVLTSELEGVSTGSPVTVSHKLSMLLSVCRGH